MSLVLIVSKEGQNVEYRLLVKPAEAYRRLVAISCCLNENNTRFMFSMRLVETEIGLCKTHGMGCGLYCGIRVGK
jgi:hypothetical protein